MNMKKDSYVKIEMKNDMPFVSMEYEDVDSFRDLMFCLLSSVGNYLCYSTISENLTINNKHQELEILEAIMDLDDKNKDKDSDFTSPSSFR